MRFGTLVVEEEGGRRRAAGVFSGQVDEGEGVDEQQAARGQRQGHGGSWRPRSREAGVARAIIAIRRSLSLGVF